MIDPAKNYKTFDGRKARVAFIEAKVAHVHVEDINVSAELKEVGAGWMPMLMDAETGYPYNVEPSSGWAVKNQLVEVKPTKQISVTIFIDRKGKCFTSLAERGQADLDALFPFAELTINAEVEEGSKRVVTI